MKDLNALHIINYNGLNISVLGDYYCGSDGDYETPPDPNYFEIEEIHIVIPDCSNLVNITELIDNLGGMDEIEEMILNQFYR